MWLKGKRSTLNYYCFEKKKNQMKQKNIEAVLHLCQTFGCQLCHFGAEWEAHGGVRGGCHLVERNTSLATDSIVSKTILDMIKSDANSLTYFITLKTINEILKK